MKTDKRNPVHWLRLLKFFFAGVAGLLVRTLKGRSAENAPVILYGHKLHGNLLPIYEALRAGTYGVQPVFLTMDPEYLDKLKERGVICSLAGSLNSVKTLSKAKAIITDHGLHSLGLLLFPYQLTGMYFFDVWHGIPFKGFDADDFRVQRRYDEVWVASELLKKIYIARYGFPQERVFATGYARTDRLVNRKENPLGIRESLGLPATGPLILFAPTWAQDNKGRSIYPFGTDPAHFLRALSAFAQTHGATLLLRSHLNTGCVVEEMPPGIVPLPAARYPDTEEILLISDMLVCDWSSISFDYLLLDRPTFFLDVKAPFKKAFSLGPEYRFGPVISSLDALISALDDYMMSPDRYWNDYGRKHRSICTEVYGDKADGQSTQRCVERLIDRNAQKA